MRVDEKNPDLKEKKKKWMKNGRQNPKQLTK